MCEKINPVTPMETKQQIVTLNRKDLMNVFLRFSCFPMVTINYERFQTLQYFSALSNVLQKLFPDKRDRIEAARRHMAFFNTTPQWMGFIMGITVATEEQIANSEYGEERVELENSINIVKASLMGPLAGIGDSLGATIGAIIGALSAGFALNGSIFGAILCLILGNTYYFGVAYYGFFYSYKNGMKVIRDMNRTGILDRIMESATILGMTAVGALIPSWVGFNLTTNINIGDYILNIQAELNNIIPGLVPLGLTIFLAYLYKKNISSLKLVVLIFVIAFLFSFLKISQ